MIINIENIIKPGDNVSEEFEDILKLVKAFVFNPKLLFMTYNEEVHKNKIVLSTTALKKGIMQDEKLDKPAGKIMKKIRH